MTEPTANADGLTEVVLSSKRIFAGKVISVRVDTVRLPNGRSSDREIVEHHPAVVVLPFDSDGQILLVKQFRLAARESMLELPAGGMEPGETPEEAAARELREETGFAPGKLEKLSGFYVAPGYAEEYLHLFRATDLIASPLPPDEDELAELIRMPLQDAITLVRGGAIHDAKTIIGLLWALADTTLS